MQSFKKAVPTLLALAAGIVGGSVSTAIQGGYAHGAADVVETSKLVIVDGNDKVRGHFGVLEGITVLALNGTDQRPRAMMAVESDGTPSMALLGSDTKVRVGMDVYDDGVTRMTFSRPNGTAAVGVLMSPDGEGVIMIKDGNGEILWSAPPGLE